MDDAWLLVVDRLLAASDETTATAASESLLAFVKLQAVHRGTRQRFLHDRALWSRLEAQLPRWSLPEHLGLRRRVLTGIKLVAIPGCLACRGPARRVFVAFQGRLCLRCCGRLLVSDHELAWRHGVLVPPDAAAAPPFVARYTAATNVRVRFFLRAHHRLGRGSSSSSLLVAASYRRLWPGVGAAEVGSLVLRMA
jgi:hypothetical protein